MTIMTYANANRCPCIGAKCANENTSCPYLIGPLITKTVNMRFDMHMREFPECVPD